MASKHNSLEDIADVLTSLRDKKKAQAFLHALLTPRERARLAGRWRLVRLLAEGTSQREIARRLGMSLCKITRGSRELRLGAPAFREIVRRFAETKKRKRT